MRLCHVLALLLLSTLPRWGAAADWRYAVGVHEFRVPDVDSATYGLTGSLLIDHRTDSGIRLFGIFDLYLDHDKDELDSDHIPVWWEVHVGADGDFWRTGPLRLGWTFDIESRENTVGAVERQVTALPALVAGFDNGVAQFALEAGVGWFFLEIDDDAPRVRGYSRSELPNNTRAYSFAAQLDLKLGDAWSVYARTQRWWDDHQTLETRYTAALRLASEAWAGGCLPKHSALVFSADRYEYNLDAYNKAGGPTILAWNDDLLLKLVLEIPW